MRAAIAVTLAIFFIAVICCDAQAQDSGSVLNIEGVWEGTMTHGTDGYSPTWRLTFVFERGQGGSQIKGTTRIQAGDQFAVFSLRGTLSGRTLTATEGAIIDQDSSRMPAGWCMNRSMKLRLNASDELEGTWSSSTTGCTGGSIIAARGVSSSADGQRDKAKRLACSAPAGSLGREAICPNFDLWFVKALGNQCAGRVGDLYQAHKAALGRPATDENIVRWADMETEYFQEQGGCTAILGSVLSRNQRIEWMKEARDRH